MIRALVESVSGYPGLLGFCAISGILFPLPEDFPLVYAGVRIAEGHFAWGPTLAVSLVGVFIRDVVAYWLGRLLGDRLLTSKLAQTWIGTERIERAEAMVRDRGSVAVLIGRFLIGFRAPIFAVAGASHVPFRKFVGWNTLGLVVAVPGVIWLGWFFGEPITDSVFYVMARAREVVALLFFLGVAYFAIARYRNGNETSIL